MHRAFFACVSAFAASLLIASVASAAIIPTGFQATSTKTPTTNVLGFTATSYVNNDPVGQGFPTPTLTVEVTDNNYAAVVANILTAASGTFVNATGSTVTFNFYIDRGNSTQFGKTELIDSFSMTVPDANESFSHTATRDLLTDVSDLFSMTLQMTLTLVPGGALNNISQTEEAPIVQATVPEPASSALLGIGLIALGLTRHRRA